MAIIASFSVAAQGFQRRCPIGEAMKGNPNFIGTAYLYPMSEVTDAEYLSATTDAVQKYAEANKVLSPRQQAIVAIGSYTGRGDLQHLAGALAEGLDAGMTVNEIKEILVQAYAYAGFPRSLRALQTFMALLDKRKAAGINDPLGKEATPVPDMDDATKYALGKKKLAELSGIPVDAPASGYAVFAPVIDKFLKEHLFADIFDRDILSWQDRELATVSVITGVGGVEPMAASHMGICLHQGLTPDQLSALLNIIEINLGPEYTTPLRPVVEKFGNRK